MYIGFRNNKPSSVGGKDFAISFNTKEEAMSWKDNFNVNDRYQVVEDV